MLPLRMTITKRRLTGLTSMSVQTLALRLRVVLFAHTGILVRTTVAEYNLVTIATLNGSRCWTYYLKYSV